MITKIEDGLKSCLTELKEILKATSLSFQGVGGGCIGQSGRLQPPAGKNYFLKMYTGEAGEKGLPACEAQGLLAIKDTQTLRIPEVLHVGSFFLLLEWIPASANTSSEFFRKFGQQLAQMHLKKVSLWG